MNNVAYLNQANNFSAANTFSAAGTALTVTNNANIGGTLAVTGTVTGGTYNGQTISSSANFTGSVAVATTGSFGTGLTVTSGGATITAGGLTVSAGGANITGNSTITGTLGGLTALTSAGTITFSSLNSSGVVHTNGSGVLSTSAVILGTDTSGDYVANLGSLTGLSTSGNSGAGSTPTLSVNYGSGANTAVQGNTNLTCASGTGNLSGGGNSITLGSGGSCNNLTITNSPTFSGDLTVQGATGISVGVPGSVTGNINLANSTSSRQVVLQGLNPSGTGNATVQIPTIAGGATDTVCLVTLGNCAGSGGGITGSGTTGTIAKFSAAGNIVDSILTEVVQLLPLPEP